MPADSEPLRRWRAVADFAPAPGALYELPLSRNDEVAVVSAAQAPEGWLFVRHESGVQGLVP